jgi:dienelactone hydrolase
VQLIVDWRRGVDLLLSRKDVDPHRLAYVGHSYGGAMGGLLAGVEKRLKAYALVVGDGGLVSHFKAGDGEPNPLPRLRKATRERWLAAMEPIEPLHWVGRATPARLLFQNGRRDRIVPETSSRAYQAAGSEPKTLKWYDADHFLNDQATRDRHLWLAEQVGIGKPE